MAILWTIIIGFFVGLIARFVKPGNDSMGMLATTALGVAGAFTAGLLGQALGWYLPGEPAGLIASIIGAVLLLYLVAAMRSRPARV